MARAWAVARVVILEIARSSGARIFLPILFAVAWFAPRAATRDDLVDRLRILVSYGLGLPAFLVALAVVGWATSSVAGEIDRRTTMHLGTKPLRGYEWILGKWLGVVTIGIVLWIALVCLFAARVGVAVARADGAEREQARTRFLLTRVERPVVPPPVTDAAVENAVMRQWSDRSGESRPPTASERERIETRVRRRLAVAEVAPGASAVLEFPDIDARDEDTTLVLRYRLHLVPWHTVAAEVEWRAGGKSLGRGHVPQSSWGQIDVPASLVANDGALSVEISNREPLDSGVRILIPSGAVMVREPVRHLGLDLVLSVPLFLAQLGFLVAVAVAGAAAFSLPTANLLAYTVLLGAFSSGLLESALSNVAPEASGNVATGILELLFLIASKVLVALPDLASEQPAGRLAEGLAITSSSIGSAVLWTLLLRGGLALAIGAIVWTRREPAKASVEHG